jgi:hypothetical protein
MIDNALYTPEMLQHWQEKWVKGGRFSTGNKEIPNAPDQKLGIVGGKTTFMANQKAVLWKVPGTGILSQSNTGAINATEGVGYPIPVRSVNLILAAQYGLFAQDATVSRAAADALLRQVREPSTNWKRSAGPYGSYGDESKTSDNGRFANNNFVTDGPACLWMYTEWFMRYCHTYWLVKHVLSTSEVQEIQQWCLHFGNYCMLDRQSLDSKWTNRKAEFEKENPNLSQYGQYRGTASAAIEATNSIAGFDGRTEKRFAWQSNGWINNRRNKMQCAAGHAGVIAGDAALMKYARVTLEEMLAFFIGSEGTIAEHNRATASWPSKGLNYAISTIFTYIPLADYMLRLYGDDRLYTLFSSLGHGCTEDPKPNVTRAKAMPSPAKKDLAFVLTSYGKYLTGEFKFKTKDGLLINGKNGAGTVFQQSDVSGHAIAYNFYARIKHPLAENIHRLCLRSEPGIYGYKTGGQIQGQGSLTGNNAMNNDMPSAMWMFEGLVANQIPSYAFEEVVIPPQPVTRILSFTLVNADNGSDMMTLADGVTLDLLKLPTRNLNIRANPDPAKVGSVVFSLLDASGATTQRTESAEPYFAFGDSNGKPNAWTPAVGAYTIKATPYSEAGGKGTAGTPLTVNFIVVETVWVDYTGPVEENVLTGELRKKPVILEL